MKNTINIKAVEMVRRIRDTHYEENKDKTWEERVEFYKEKAHILHKWLEKQNARKEKTSS